MAGAGGAKELPISDLIAMTKGPADDETADLLQLPRSPRRPEVFGIRNVLRIGDTPVVVSDVQVPAQLFAGLTTRMLREQRRTLYAAFQQHFVVTIVKIREQLKAVRADAVAAEFWNFLTECPVLELRRIACSFERRPVEVRRSQIDTRSNQYRFEQGDNV